MRTKTITSLIFVTLLGAIIGKAQIKRLGTGRIEVPEDSTKYSLVETVDPEYPADLRERGVSGRVVVKVLIDKQGTVVSATGVEGNSALVDSTLNAVKQWKFRPYILDNEPVEVETTVTVDFAQGVPYVRATKPHRGPMRVRISQGVAEGNIVHKVEPYYPQKAKEKHIQGDVILRFIIDEHGNVADLVVLQGDPLLAESALNVVKQWKYRPYLLNGQPVQVETTAKISYRM